MKTGLINHRSTLQIIFRKQNEKNAVADPDFPREGSANSPGGTRQHTILPNFPQNCMKLKEFGLRGARVPHAPLDPPLKWFRFVVVSMVSTVVIEIGLRHRVGRARD